MKMHSRKYFHRTWLLMVLAILFGICCHGCTNQCNQFFPNKCLNTITGAVGSRSTFGPFSTANVNNVKTLQCGSGSPFLNDFVSQFSVSINGVYDISTFNLSQGGDTTLQINKCNGDFVQCNDDIDNTVSLFPTDLATICHNEEAW
jgi:hypothetical protein